MTDDLEQRLRALRPLPIPDPVRQRIVAAVRAAPRQRSSALSWLPTLAAAALGVTVLAVVQPTASHPGDTTIDDTMVSYGQLLRHISDPAELLETIDRSRNPFPRFSAFEQTPSQRNRP